MSGAFVSALALCVMTVEAKPVEACSYSPILSLNEDLSEGLVGIPVSGILPIYAHVSSDEPSEQPSLTVQTLGGVIVSGTLDKGRFRLFWRSDAPLSPNTTYQATLAGSENDPISFSFTTAENNEVPELQITPGELYLGELHRSENEACCYTGAESSCGGPWLECWTRTTITTVDFWAQFSIDKEIARYYLLEGEAAEAVSVHTTIGSSGETGIVAEFSERAGEYCAALRVRSLVDGTQTTETFCQSAEGLVEAAPFVAEEPNFAICADPPFDSQTGEEIATSGCSTSGGNSGLFLSFLMLLGLIGRRRPTSGVQHSD